jgi:hypothetical protein
LKSAGQLYKESMVTAGRFSPGRPDEVRIMPKQETNPRNAGDQTSQRSLKAHTAALKEGRRMAGTGYLVKDVSARKPGESPVIVLPEVGYHDLCEIGKKFLAYRWVAPAIMASSGPGVIRDCAGRSCATGKCPEPCVCDPHTLRCVSGGIP